MRATASHGQGLSITVISQFDFSCFVGCKMVNYMCIYNYIYIYTYIIPCYTPMIPYVSWLKEPWFCRRNHLLLAGPLAIRMTPNGWLLLGSWLDNGRLVDATIIIISNHITHWNWGFPIFRQGQQDCTSMGWFMIGTAWVFPQNWRSDSTNCIRLTGSYLRCMGWFWDDHPNWCFKPITIWLFNIAMENPL